MLINTAVSYATVYSQLYNFIIFNKQISIRSQGPDYYALICTYYMIGCSALIFDLLRSGENLSVSYFVPKLWPDLINNTASQNFYKDCFKIFPIMLASKSKIKFHVIFSSIAEQRRITLLLTFSSITNRRQYVIENELTFSSKYTV